MNHTLSLCMIVKNESHNLPRCLASVADLVDEIVVTDTGSTDDTVQKAKELGAKVYHYTWDYNFSNARNFAISKAKGSWILLLDADEELEKADHQKVRALLKNKEIDGAHFTVYNFMGRKVSDTFTLHNAFRLLRNNGQYHFEGEIHEQIVRKDSKDPQNRLPITDIRVYHYGYMEDEASSKQKRKRNIPILEKQLEKDPENSFALFNLGNEYLAMNDHEKAMELYRRSLAGVDARRAYAPHLYHRMISCCRVLGRYEEGLKLVEDGLTLYPACTDYEYSRADIYYNTGRYTLAIESLNRCLELGEAPPTLRFIAGVGGYRASMALGEVYFELGDYGKAITHYNKVLAQAPGRCGVLYRIGAALSKLCSSPQEVVSHLNRYFADANYPPNQIVSCDILLELGQPTPVAQAIAEGVAGEQYVADFQFMAAKMAFLSGNLMAAMEQFEQLLTQKEQPVILVDTAAHSAKYAFVAGLALEQEMQGRLLHLVRKHCGTDCYKVCLQLHHIRTGSGRKLLTPDQTSEAGLTIALDLLGRLLDAKQPEVFEKLLPILNMFESKRVLLRLAELYESKGLSKLATDCVLRSVKELDTIDRKGAKILCKHLS